VNTAGKALAFVSRLSKCVCLLLTTGESGNVKELRRASGELSSQPAWTSPNINRLGRGPTKPSRRTDRHRH